MLGWRCCSVVQRQVQGPGFNTQYRKKKKKCTFQEEDALPICITEPLVILHAMHAHTILIIDTYSNIIATEES